MVNSYDARSTLRPHKHHGYFNQPTLLPQAYGDAVTLKPPHSPRPHVPSLLLLIIQGPKHASTFNTNKFKNDTITAPRITPSYTCSYNVAWPALVPQNQLSFPSQLSPAFIFTLSFNFPNLTLPCAEPDFSASGLLVLKH